MKGFNILIFLLVLILSLNALVESQDLSELNNAVDKKQETLRLKDNNHNEILSRHLDERYIDYFNITDEYYKLINTLYKVTQAYEYSLLSLNAVKINLMDTLQDKYNEREIEKYDELRQAEAEKNLKYNEMLETKVYHKDFKEKRTFKRILFKRRLRDKLDENSNSKKAYLKLIDSNKLINKYRNILIEDRKVKDKLIKELKQMTKYLNKINEKFKMSESRLYNAYQLHAAKFDKWQKLDEQKKEVFSAVNTAWDNLEQALMSREQAKFEKNKLIYLDLVNKFKEISEARYKAHNEIYNDLLAINAAEREFFELHFRKLKKESTITYTRSKLVEYK